MSRMKGRRVVWTRSAIVALALAWAAAVVAAQCWLPQVHLQPAHSDHPLATSVGSEFVLSADHAHLVDNSTPPCPEQFATAVLPRTATVSFESAPVAAAAGIPGILTYLVVPAGRGPPSVPVYVRAGQDLLTRYCRARR